MREILFRGKRTGSGEWVEGYACVFGDTTQIFAPFTEEQKKKHIGHFVSMIDGLWNIVRPETVGQYTGLTDKNGKKIFEGDIVKAQDDIFGSPFCNGITGKVVYEETAFFIEPQNVMETEWLFNECAVYEVIGNIHDNPELLKTKE